MRKCPRGKKRNPKTGRCKTPCAKSQAVNPRTNRCVSKRYLAGEDVNESDDSLHDEFDEFDYFDDLDYSAAVAPAVAPAVSPPPNPAPPNDVSIFDLTRAQFVSRLHEVSILGEVPVLFQAPSNNVVNPSNPNQWASPDPFGPRDIEILKMIVDTSRSIEESPVQLQGLFRPAGERAQSPFANCREFTFRGEGSSLSECGVFDVTSGDHVVSIFEDSAKYENAVRTNSIIWNTRNDVLLTSLDFYESALMGVHGVNVDRCILTPSGVWRFFTFGYDLDRLPEERVHQIIDGYSQHKQQIIAQGDNGVGDDGIANSTRQLWQYMTHNMEDLVFVEYYDFSGGILHQ